MRKNVIYSLLAAAAMPMTGAYAVEANYDAATVWDATAADLGGWTTTGLTKQTVDSKTVLGTSNGTNITHQLGNFVAGKYRITFDAKFPAITGNTSGYSVNFQVTGGKEDKSVSVSRSNSWVTKTIDVEIAAGDADLVFKTTNAGTGRKTFYITNVKIELIADFDALKAGLTNLLDSKTYVDGKNFQQILDESNATTYYRFDVSTYKTEVAAIIADVAAIPETYAGYKENELYQGDNKNKFRKRALKVIDDVAAAQVAWMNAQAAGVQKDNTTNINGLKSTLEGIQTKNAAVADDKNLKEGLAKLLEEITKANTGFQARLDAFKAKAVAPETSGDPFINFAANTELDGIKSDLEGAFKTKVDDAAASQTNYEAYQANLDQTNATNWPVTVATLRTTLSGAKSTIKSTYEDDFKALTGLNLDGTKVDPVAATSLEGYTQALATAYENYDPSADAVFTRDESALTASGTGIRARVEKMKNDIDGDDAAVTTSYNAANDKIDAIVGNAGKSIKGVVTEENEKIEANANIVAFPKMKQKAKDVADAYKTAIETATTGLRAQLEAAYAAGDKTAIDALTFATPAEVTAAVKPYLDAADELRANFDASKTVVDNLKTDHKAAWTAKVSVYNTLTAVEKEPLKHEYDAILGAEVTDATVITPNIKQLEDQYKATFATGNTDDLGTIDMSVLTASDAPVVAVGTALDTWKGHVDAANLNYTNYVALNKLIKNDTKTGIQDKLETAVTAVDALKSTDGNYVPKNKPGYDQKNAILALIDKEGSATALVQQIKAAYDGGTAKTLFDANTIQDAITGAGGVQEQITNYQKAAEDAVKGYNEFMAAYNTDKSRINTVRNNVKDHAIYTAEGYEYKTKLDELDKLADGQKTSKLDVAVATEIADGEPYNKAWNAAAALANAGTNKYDNSAFDGNVKEHLYDIQNLEENYAKDKAAYDKDQTIAAYNTSKGNAATAVSGVETALIDKFLKIYSAETSIVADPAWNAEMGTVRIDEAGGVKALYTALKGAYETQKGIVDDNTKADPNSFSNTDLKGFKEKLDNAQAALTALVADVATSDLSKLIEAANKLKADLVKNGEKYTELTYDGHIGDPGEPTAKGLIVTLKSTLAGYKAANEAGGTYADAIGDSKFDTHAATFTTIDGEIDALDGKVDTSYGQENLFAENTTKYDWHTTQGQKLEKEYNDLVAKVNNFSTKSAALYNNWKANKEMLEAITNTTDGLNTVIAAADAAIAVLTTSDKASTDTPVTLTAADSKAESAKAVSVFAAKVAAVQTKSDNLKSAVDGYYTAETAAAKQSEVNGLISQYKSEIVQIREDAAANKTQYEAQIVEYSNKVNNKKAAEVEMGLAKYDEFLAMESALVEGKTNQQVLEDSLAYAKQLFDEGLTKMKEFFAAGTAAQQTSVNTVQNLFTQAQNRITWVNTYLTDPTQAITAAITGANAAELAAVELVLNNAKAAYNAAQAIRIAYAGVTVANDTQNQLAATANTAIATAVQKLNDDIFSGLSDIEDARTKATANKTAQNEASPLPKLYKSTETYGGATKSDSEVANDLLTAMNKAKSDFIAAIKTALQTYWDGTDYSTATAETTISGTLTEATPANYFTATGNIAKQKANADEAVEDATIDAATDATKVGALFTKLNDAVSALNTNFDSWVNAELNAAAKEDFAARYATADIETLFKAAGTGYSNLFPTYENTVYEQYWNNSVVAYGIQITTRRQYDAYGNYGYLHKGLAEEFADFEQTYYTEVKGYYADEDVMNTLWTGTIDGTRSWQELKDRLDNVASAWTTLTGTGSHLEMAQNAKSGDLTDMNTYNTARENLRDMWYGNEEKSIASEKEYILKTWAGLDAAVITAVNNFQTTVESYPLAEQSGTGVSVSGLTAKATAMDNIRTTTLFPALQTTVLNAEKGHMPESMFTELMNDYNKAKGDNAEFDSDNSINKRIAAAKKLVITDNALTYAGILTEEEEIAALRALVSEANEAGIQQRIWNDFMAEGTGYIADLRSKLDLALVQTEGANPTEDAYEPENTGYLSSYGDLTKKYRETNATNPYSTLATDKANIAKEIDALENILKAHNTETKKDLALYENELKTRKSTIEGEIGNTTTAATLAFKANENAQAFSTLKQNLRGNDSNLQRLLDLVDTNLTDGDLADAKDLFGEGKTFEEITEGTRFSAIVNNIDRLKYNVNYSWRRARQLETNFLKSDTELDLLPNTYYSGVTETSIKDDIKDAVLLAAQDEAKAYNAKQYPTAPSASATSSLAERRAEIVDWLAVPANAANYTAATLAAVNLELTTKSEVRNYDYWPYAEYDYDLSINGDISRLALPTAYTTYETELSTYKDAVDNIVGRLNNVQETLKTTQKGDITTDGEDTEGNGQIDIFDFDKIVEYMLTDETDAAVVAACDLNGNGKIDVGDCMMLANIIVSGNSDVVYPSRLVQNLNETATAEIVSNEGNVRRLAVSLNNEQLYTAFQMDVVLPEGMTLVSSELSTRADGHMLMNRDLGAKQRLAAVNIVNNAFSGNNGAVVFIDVEVGENYKGGTVQFENVAFSTPEGFVREFAIQGEATGIMDRLSDMAAGAKEKIYNLGGRMMNGLKKGINIIRKDNGSIEKKVVK